MFEQGQLALSTRTVKQLQTTRIAHCQHQIAVTHTRGSPAHNADNVGGQSHGAHGFRCCCGTNLEEVKVTPAGPSELPDSPHGFLARIVQIVNDDYLVPLQQQLQRGVAANVARASGDEYAALHARTTTSVGGTRNTITQGTFQEADVGAAAAIGTSVSAGTVRRHAAIGSATVG